MGATQNALADFFPTVSGGRHNVLFECSEGVADRLSDILTFLRVYEYNVERITETIPSV